MKKIFLPMSALFLLFVSFSSTVFAQVTIADAGSSFVNGTYTFMGTSQGKNYYQGGTSSSYYIYWEPGYSPAAWKIAYGNGQGIYLNTTNTTLPPATGWEVDNVYSAGGALPVPTLSGDVSLPVELTSFTATTKGKNVELKWNTAMEVNNYGFEVERCLVGQAFLPVSQTRMSDLPWTKIGFVEGSGTTNAAKSYSFTDASASGKIAFRLKQIDRDGKFEYSKTVEATVAQVKTFALDQNYPNPFNPMTMINFQIPVNSHVTLKVYDAIGREVATLVNEVKEAGYYSTTFNATKLASGIYFARLQSGDKLQMKKMVLMK